MSEFRLDPVSGRWVIIAPERAARPTDFAVARRQPAGGFCPFCEGNEDKTPPELMALRSGGDANRAGWRVRVVPNRFPALTLGDAALRDGTELFRRRGGYGQHEVIIESPRHVVTLCELENADACDVLLVYRRRMRYNAQNERLAYGMVFKNVGAAAGATLEHSHAQLIATPVVPSAVRSELSRARRFLRKEGACIFCRMVEDELNAQTRVVFKGEHFVALAPFASRCPFETWVLPRRHVSHFEDQPEESFHELASILRNTLLALDEILDRPAYNAILHSAPFRKPAEHFHWHVEIIPRVTGVAGFEWGTGFYINPVPPEDAAALLRQTSLAPVPQGQEKR